MKKILLIPLAIIAVVACVGIAKAMPANTEAITPSGTTVSVPDIAIEKSKALGITPGTFEKTIFVHQAKEERARPAKAAACYKLLGVKWGKLPVNYVVIHPDVANVSPGAIIASAKTWDVATSKQVFGSATIDSSANWDNDKPDGRNEYSFGDYSQNGVIAVTVIWTGVPLGTRIRQIVEYDVMFDTNFTWGDATVNNPTPVMDLENISTHETGHGLGLNDIYTSNCSTVTMFGYSNYGEVQKRTLEAPDINGLQKMYGM